MELKEYQKEKMFKLGLKSPSLTNYNEDYFLLSFYNVSLNKVQSIKIEKIFYVIKMHEIIEEIKTIKLKEIKKLIDETTNCFIKKILTNEYDYIYFNV